MKRIVEDLWSKQFAAFLLVGGIAASVNVIARALLDDYVGFQASIVAAYLIGMIAAFVLNKRFVFEASHHACAAREALYFTLVNLAGVCLVWAITVGLAEVVFPWWSSTFPGSAPAYPRLTAHMIGVTSPAVSSYFGHKYLSFRRSPLDAGG